MLRKPQNQSRLLGEKLISRPCGESKHATPSGNGKCWKTVACSGVFMRDCLGYDGRISTRAPILWLVRTSCSCYHASVVACLHACVYVCGVLPEKRQLVKNLIVQLHFCFRLDISSDRKMDLFSAFMNVTALNVLDIHFLTFGIGSNMYIRLMSTTSLCVNFIDFLKNRMTVSRSTFVKDLRRKHKWRSDGILTYYMLSDD